MKIRIIANWFGNPPPTLQCWLDSIAWNRSIDWLFVTDTDLSDYEVPANVTVLRSTFQEIKVRFERVLGLEVRYLKPWDFCSFRPILGVAFADFLDGYDYWGWTDCDLIYGDLSAVIPHLDGVDKVLPKGHLSFIRNDKWLHAKILNHPLTRKILARGGIGAASCFDEFAFPNVVLPEIGAIQRLGPPFANFSDGWGHFSLLDTFALCDRLSIPHNPGPHKHSNVPCIFLWKDGCLKGRFVCGGVARQVELLYIHFYKRYMRCNRLLPGRQYLIVPNDIREVRVVPQSVLSIRWKDRPKISWRWWKGKLKWAVLVRKVKSLV